MDTLRLVLDAAWKVLWVGLLLGAGVPALFAMGVKLNASHEVSGANGAVVTRSAPLLSRIVGWLCFALVAYAVVVGIMIILAGGMGKIVDWNGVLPHFAPKPH